MPIILERMVGNKESSETPSQDAQKHGRLGHTGLPAEIYRQTRWARRLCSVGDISVGRQVTGKQKRNIVLGAQKVRNRLCHQEGHWQTPLDGMVVKAPSRSVPWLSGKGYQLGNCVAQAQRQEGVWWGARAEGSDWGKTGLRSGSRDGEFGFFSKCTSKAFKQRSARI